MDPRYNHYPPNHGYYAPPPAPPQPQEYQTYNQQFAPQPRTHLQSQHYPPVQNYNGPMVAMPQPPQPYPQYAQPQYHPVGAYIPQSPRTAAPAPLAIPAAPMVKPVLQAPEPKPAAPQARQPVHATTPSSTTPKPVPQKPRESLAEPQLLLLSLAEEYIAAAHAIAPMLSLIRGQGDLEQYHQLIATGLSCMEIVLRKFRLHPRMESTLSLRYATLLFEETENTAEAEAILSKGITLCERNKLLDLKYSMQHLLARVLFKTNSRAAFKHLDSVIAEAEAYQHVVWSYALRFLRVSLSLQKASGLELLSAVQNLRAISDLSHANGDRAVFVTCATLEAMVHLRTHGLDSIEQAQRAIASARSHQLQMTSKESAQILTLLNCVDLACALLQGTPDQAEAKMTAFQALLDETGDSNSWPADGLFTVPIDVRTGDQLTGSTGNIFQMDPSTNKQCITFSWLSQRDLYALGYYLSAVSVHLSNKEKTTEYLLQGIKTTDGKCMSLPEYSFNSYRV